MVWTRREESPLSTHQEALMVFSAFVHENPRFIGRLAASEVSDKGGGEETGGGAYSCPCCCSVVDKPCLAHVAWGVAWDGRCGGIVTVSIGYVHVPVRHAKREF